MPNTALAEKMASAGVNTEGARLFNLAYDLLKKSSSFELARGTFERAVQGDYNLLREICRSYLQDRADDMRGPNGREGLKRDADRAGNATPSRSPQRDGAGLLSPADRAIETVPRSVSPGVSRRGLTSIAAVQPAVAKSIFQLTVLPDGRSLDQVQWHELPKLAKEYRQHSRVLMALYRKVQNVDAFLTVDKVVHAADVTEAIQQAENANDIY